MVSSLPLRHAPFTDQATYFILIAELKGRDYCYILPPSRFTGTANINLACRAAKPPNSCFEAIMTVNSRSAEPIPCISLLPNHLVTFKAFRSAARGQSQTHPTLRPRRWATWCTERPRGDPAVKSVWMTATRRTGENKPADFTRLDTHTVITHLAVCPCVACLLGDTTETRETES